MTTETEPEEIEITDWDAFRYGDVVMQRPTPSGLGKFTVHREVPIKPTPGPGTLGTAIVEGTRIHGLLDEDGDFAFMTWDDETGAEQTYTRDFEDFLSDGETPETALPSVYDLVMAIEDESPLHLGAETLTSAKRAAERVLELLKEKNA